MSVDLQFDVTGSTEKGQEIAKRASVLDAPFLSAKFWEPETVIIGKVIESRKTQNGPVIALELIEPATVEVYHRGDRGRVGRCTHRQPCRVQSRAAARSR